MANIAKREITLFTTAVNVDKEIVIEITEKMKLLKSYRPNRKMLAAGFDVDNVRFALRSVNIDTLVHFIEIYSFEKRINGYGTSIMIEAILDMPYGRIILSSEYIEVNLLPNL